jgi:hypothetical protein
VNLQVLSARKRVTNADPFDAAIDALTQERVHTVLLLATCSYKAALRAMPSQVAALLLIYRQAPAMADGLRARAFHPREQERRPRRHLVWSEKRR